MELVTAQVSSFSLRRKGFVERGLDRLDRGRSNPTPAAFREELLNIARSVSRK